MILKNHQKIINSKFTQNRHSELNKKLSELNNKFTQLEGWANFNTAYKLTLSENKKQDLVKAQELFEKLLQGPEISKAHTEKAKRLLNALKNRREEYRKFIEEAKKEFKVVELPLTMDKFTLSAQVVGGVIKALNKHTVYGGWQGRGLGRESVFAFNPENKGEIDILFEVFQEKLMTEDLALEVRKCLFPRKGDDPEESDSDSDD